MSGIFPFSAPRIYSAIGINIPIPTASRAAVNRVKKITTINLLLDSLVLFNINL